MAAKGDDHVRRERIEKARKFLPEVSTLKAHERSKRLAAFLGVGVREAIRIRTTVEREALEAAVAAAAADSLDPIKFWLDHDAALVELVDKARDLYERSIARDQLNAAAAALKQWHVFIVDRATWNGARAKEPQRAGGGVVTVTFDFGPDEDAGRGDG